MPVLSINIYSDIAQPANGISKSQPKVISIFISNLKVFKSKSGLISVTGTVQNNSTDNVDHIKVVVTFYNADNNIKKEIGKFISGPYAIYEPEAIQKFSFIIINPFDYDHYTARAQGDIIN